MSFMQNGLSTFKLTEIHAIWWLGHSDRKYSTLCSIVSDFELAPTN